MDFSEAVRLVTTVSQDVIAAMLQQFRIDQEAARAADQAQFRIDLETARAADQAYFRGLFNNLLLRMDRIEVADRLRSSLPASASTSFSSSTSSSSIGQDSPSMRADLKGIPERRNNDDEFFLDPEDDGHGFNHAMFFNFGENVSNEPRSPCSGIAAISLTEPLPGPHAAHPSCAPIHSSYELGVFTGGANVHEPLPVQLAMSTTWAPIPATCQLTEPLPGPHAAHPSCAPIHSSYELGVSTGGANVHEPMPVQPAMPTTWEPTPATYQPGVSTHNDHQDIRDAEPISISGLRHNPRVCALCAFPFTETKYRNMLPRKFFFFAESSLQALQEAHVASFRRDQPVQVLGGISSS